MPFVSCSTYAAGQAAQDAAIAAITTDCPEVLACLAARPTTTQGVADVTEFFGKDGNFHALPPDLIAEVTAGNGVTVTGDGYPGTPFVVSVDGSETKVIAGTNTTVTGSGTIANPYVVNAALDGAETIVNGAGSVTVTGAGTAASPYVVAVDGSETIVQAGNGVTVSGTGTTAAPYVVAVDGSETKVVGAGSVTVTGAGTTASPYTVIADGSETVVQAGTNTTVTGSGTTADPYIVSSTASGGGTADGSETIVTAGDNVTVTGTGTAATPYVVSVADPATAAACAIPTRYLGLDASGNVTSYDNAFVTTIGPATSLVSSGDVAGTTSTAVGSIATTATSPVASVTNTDACRTLRGIVNRNWPYSLDTTSALSGGVVAINGYISVNGGAWTLANTIRKTLINNIPHFVDVGATLGVGTFTVAPGATYTYQLKTEILVEESTTGATLNVASITANAAVRFTTWY